MKKLALVLTLCAVGSLALGQVVVKAGEGKEGTGWVITGEGAGRAGGGLGASVVDQIGKLVKLSDEQVTKMKAIEEAADKATKEWQEQNAEKIKAAHQAIQDAFAAKDNDALQKAVKASQELYQPLTALQQKAREDVMNVLTADQKLAYRQGTVMQWVTPRFAAAKLTDDQLAKGKAAIAEAAKDPKAADKDLYQKAVDAIQGSLTDEQKEAMKKAAANNPWGAPVGAANPAPGAQPGAPTVKAGGEGGNMIIIKEEK